MIPSVLMLLAAVVVKLGGDCSKAGWMSLSSTVRVPLVTPLLGSLLLHMAASYVIIICMAQNNAIL